MSMPSWLRPPRGPYGELSVPLTGVEMVAELHEPLAGACVVGTVVLGWLVGVVAEGGVAFTCPPTVVPAPVSPCTASSVPACCSVCSTCCVTCGETFDPPSDAPLAPACSNSEDHVLGPTMPSTSRPAESWYLRTAASVCGPKMPSEATPSLVCTCATSSPWLPTRSGRPPSRISIALLAGDSAATAALTSPETWAAAMGAPGPTTTAVASAADTCFLRLFSRRAFGSSARLRRDRSSERSQSSGAARSLWAFVIHVPFLSGLRG